MIIFSENSKGKRYKCTILNKKALCKAGTFYIVSDRKELSLQSMRLNKIY